MKTVDIPRNPELAVQPDTVRALQGMTDAVLANFGLTIEQIELACFTVPGIERYAGLSEYDLEIYSIGEGVSGFNTSSSGPDADNSRRWTLYIDRHTRFGAAYDYKGTVYEKGGIIDPGPSRQNIYTGTIDQLVDDFYTKSAGKHITFTVPKDDSWGSIRIAGSAQSDFTSR